MRPVPPPPPAGFLNRAEFGNAIRWGRFDASARRPAEEITFAEVKKLRITTELAIDWRNFYAAVARQTPRNPSAQGRIVLMQRIIELLGTSND